MELEDWLIPQHIDPKWLVMRGDKGELIKRLVEITEGTGTPTLAMTAAEALEKRRQEYQLLKKSEWAQLLNIRPERYSAILSGERPVSLLMIRRAYALGVAIEPLLGVTKVRSTF